MNDFQVPLIIRGKVIDDCTIDFADRSGSGRGFATPDVNRYAEQLVCRRPGQLLDLARTPLPEIYRFLDELGRRLDLDRNPYWREAFEVSCSASNLSRAVLEYCYRTTPAILSEAHARELVEARIGADYLEGWVPLKLLDGRTIRVRALGCRSIHIIAGNVPYCAVITVLRSAVTRNDAIIKLPSNDPLTAVAIMRTMIDIDPNHPVTKHFSAGYWKGGDETTENKLYRAGNIEKIVAWGGYASIKHIAKYLGPGIDLVTLDPKSSTTLIGREAFADEHTMRSVAQRVAADVGGWDQEACVNARVVYVESGTDNAGIALANRFGEMTFAAMQQLPTHISNGPVRFDPTLKSELLAIQPLTNFYRIFSERTQLEKSGAIIVSQMDESVDFPKLLSGRVANIVPLDRIEDALDFFTAATQTVGIYPATLREQLRDRAALMGGQMFQPVGYAVAGSMVAPQDGIEPERRMCRWVVDSDFEGAVVAPPWQAL